MTMIDPPTPNHHERTARTVELHIALIEALVGSARAQHLPLDLRVMGVLHSLSEASRQVIDDFAAQCLACRATYTLTAREVAARLRVSARLVQRLAQAGALNGSRIGGRWMFTEAQLERFTLACAYVSGERVMPDTGRPWVSQADVNLVALARARLGDGDWTSRQLADALSMNRDEAYRLMLGWHTAYLIDHTGRRGLWRFAPAP